MPRAHEISTRRAELLTEKVRRIIEEGKLGASTKRVEQMMGDEYTSLDIAAALLQILSGESPGGQKSDK